MVMIHYQENKNHVIVHQALQSLMILLINQKKREKLFWLNNKHKMSKQIQIKEMLLHKLKLKKMLMKRRQLLMLMQPKKKKKESKHKLKQMQKKLPLKQKLKKILLQLKQPARLKWQELLQKQLQLQLNKQLLMH